MEVMCTCEVETTLMDIISYKKFAACLNIGELKHLVIPGQYNMMLKCATLFSYSGI
jgi:hypothetical protein